MGKDLFLVIKSEVLDPKSPGKNPRGKWGEHHAVEERKSETI